MPQNSGICAKNLIDRIYAKIDFDQIIYDVSAFVKQIGYEAVAKNLENEPINKKELVISKMAILQSEVLKEYFIELLEKDELKLFEPGYFKIFKEELIEESKRVLFFSLTTAIDLERADLKKISNDISKKMGRKVIIDLKVDKTILGGAIIKKDNYIMDFSLKTKFNKFANEWKKSLQESRENDEKH